MELKINKILGFHTKIHSALTIIPWGKNDLAYISCVGAGAVLVPLNRHGLKPLDELQTFYYLTPTPVGGRNDGASNTCPGHVSPNSSPDSTRRSKLIRVNKSNCVDASAYTKLLVVGEHGGYMPRLLLYDLLSGRCLDSVHDQHQFGVKFAKFSPSGSYVASLGTPQDGYIYVWNVSNQSLSLHASNKCISEVNDLVWVNDTQFITVGVRHIKVWNVDSDPILSGRNVILGEIADQTFECALPVLDSKGTLIFVGTSRGQVYTIPDNKLVCSDAQHAIKAISVCMHSTAKMFRVSTLFNIFEYAINGDMDTKFHPPLKTYNFGASMLLSFEKESFYVPVNDDSMNIVSFSNIEEDSPIPTNTIPQVESFLKRKGLQIRSRFIPEASTALCWNNEDQQILRWPSTLIQVPLPDITVADEGSPDESDLVVGSLCGDIWLGNQCINAHNGPVTDVHMFAASSICISSGRDRSVQIWTKNLTWSLKQTLLFSTPILRAQACTNGVSNLALVCCGANKTVYIYQTSAAIDVKADQDPAFSESPRTFQLRGMPYDIATYKNIAAISTNDKTISIIDPWSESKVVATWRPTDSNGDSVNLTHIQILENGDTLFLLGAASNKSVLVFNLYRGDLVAAQWGQGEPISGVAWTGDSVLTASGALIISELRKGDDNKLATMANTKNLVASSTLDSPFLEKTRLPRLNLSSLSPSSNSRSASPVRKIYDTGSLQLSRSVNSVRNTPGSSSPGRSPSPPPRTLTRSPTLERGRISIVTKKPEEIASSRPNLAYKPLKLGNKSTTNTEAPITRLDSTANNKARETTKTLISALNNFLNQHEPSSDDQVVKKLLLAALNKVDGLALLNEYSNNLAEQLCNRVDCQIENSFKAFSKKQG